MPTDGTRKTHGPSKYLLHFQACSWPYRKLFIPYNSPVLQQHLTAGCAHPEGAPFTGLEAEAGQGEGPLVSSSPSPEKPSTCQVVPKNPPWGQAGVAPRAAEPVGTPQPCLTPRAPAVPRAHPACPLSPQPVPEQSSSAGGAAAPRAQSFVQSHFQAQYR